MTNVQLIDSCIEKIQSGFGNLYEGSKELVALLDADPNNRDRIMSRHGWLTEDMMDTFERVGRNQVFYKLLLNDSPGFVALRRCTFSDQTRHFEEPVELLLSSKDKQDILKVPVQALSPQQTRQVFGKNRLRTLGEQRAYLEDQKSKPQPVSIDRPYSIYKGRIVFHKSCSLTMRDMAALLAEMSA